MVAFLLVLLCIFKHAHSQDVCFWGRSNTNNSNTFMNGQFVQAGTYDSRPYYTLTAGAGCPGPVYLWYRSPVTDWYITLAVPGGSQYYARCDSSNADIEAGCGPGMWQFAGGGPLDPNTFTFYGSCPEWDCDLVRITTVGNSCNHDYSVKIGTNAWSNSAGDRFWWFDPIFFNWRCAQTHCTDCPGCSNYAYTVGGWIDNTEGSSANLDFTYPALTPTIRPVQCVNVPTATPTPGPTKQPTPGPTPPPTKSPTKPPTPAPTTKSPTNQPTKSPTNQPTTRPTRIPSNPPTKPPTTNPSKQPTNPPTKAPSKQPTATPTPAPTADPSKTPTKSPSPQPTKSPVVPGSPTKAPSISTPSPSDNPSTAPTKMPSTPPTSSPSKYPSTTPTKMPSTPPTASPSKNPSTAPSNYPSIPPSKNPSFSPSKTPSSSPSKHPANTPSNDPSIAPSKTPSTDPSIAPTTMPSITPTSHPTVQPTPAPTEVSFNVIAQWSANYLSININVMNNDFGIENIQLRYNGLQTFSSKTNCGLYFDDATLDIIGQSSTCSWIVNPADATNTDDIVIHLIYSSINPPQVNLTSSLTLRAGAFEYRYLGTNIWYILNQTLLINDIKAATNPLQPDIRTKVLMLLGICDALVLDASSTQNLGGRDGDYNWTLLGEIIDPDNNDTVLYNMSSFDGNDQVFEWNEIAPNSDLMLYLNVTSWFGQHSSTQFAIKKDNRPQPQISVDGPQIFQMNNENLNGVVILTAIITFDDTCLRNNTANIPYKLEWNVTCDLCNNIGVLLSYLHGITRADGKADVISILAEDYLEVGASYIFQVNLECLEELECSTYGTLSMEYIYSDIICQIANADIFLGTMTLSQFKAYNSLYLDGITFTYDPDHDINDKSNLLWDWECLQTEYHGSISCDLLLYDSSNAQTSTEDNSCYIHFGDETGTLSYDETYQFTFTMHVYDKTQLNRAQCLDTTTVAVTIDTQGADMDFIILVVQIIATERIVNVDDTVRLIVSFIEINNNDNFELSHPDAYLIYEWSEENDLLSTQEIKLLNINNDGSGNLVIPPSSLSNGVYKFNIAITVYLGEELIGGGSAGIQIEIKPGPLITSFMIAPECDHITLATLDELFSMRYNLFVEAESNYPPLSYAFSKTQHIPPTTAYLHNQLLNNGELMNVMLPVGVFDLNAHVFDVSGTLSVKSKACDIQMDDNYHYGTAGNCLSYQVVLNNYFNRSNIQQPYAINQFIITSALFYIDYVSMEFADMIYDAYDEEVAQCIVMMLDGVLNTTYKYFDIFNSQNRFCQNDYSVQLSSLMKAWFELRGDFGFNYNAQDTKPYIKRKDIENNYEDYAADSLTILIFKMQSIMIQTLDPCVYITDHIEKVNKLSVSPESVVTSSRTIYYQNRDITNKLSPLLLEYAKYGDVLYGFIASSINFLSKIAEIDEANLYLFIVNEILDLIEKVLYIVELSKISVSIGGESSITISDNGEFEITSIRTGTTSTKGINVTVHDIDIAITQQDLLQYLSQCEAENKALCNVDVITIGLNSSQSNITFDGFQVGNECDDFDGSGVLGKNELDVNIVGQNVTNLDNNVSMTFYDAEYNADDVPICVWLKDEANNIWSTDGCFTSFDEVMGSVTCYCNHLTTFATIHELHRQDAQCIKFAQEWHFTSLLFIILFLIIIVYIIIQIHPFCVRKKRKLLCKEKSLLVFVFILILSIVNVVICISFYILENATADAKDGIAYWITILLSIPLFIYFVIFSLILYSWATVAHSLQVQDEETLRFRLRIALYSSLIIISLGLLTQLILIPLGFWEDMYKYALLVWCGLLAAAALLYSIYGFLMTRLLVRTALSMRNVVKTGAGSDMTLAKKLLISAVCIWLFFVLELVINFIVVFDITSFSESIWIRLADLLLNFGCLLIICYMYHASIKRLTQMNDLTNKCCGKARKPGSGTDVTKTKTKRTNNSTMRKVPSTSSLVPKHKKHKKNVSTMISLPRPSSSIQELSSNSHSGTNKSITSFRSSKKIRKQNKRQISAVTITEVTELTNLRGAQREERHMILEYNQNSSQLRLPDGNDPSGIGLSALGVPNTSWDANEDEDDEYEYYEDDTQVTVNSGLPKPSEVVQSASTISLPSPHDFSENGFETQQNILYAD